MKEKKFTNDNTVSLETRVALLEAGQVNLAVGLSEIKYTLEKLDSKIDDKFNRLDDKIEITRKQGWNQFTLLIAIGGTFGSVILGMLGHVAHWY